MRVLIAVDPSQHAEYAFDYYVKNIHKEGNEVNVVHVIDPPEPSLMTGVVWEEAMISGIVWDEAVEQQRERARALEEDFVNRMRKAGIHGKVMLMEGFQSGEIILNASNKEGVNLIVMGSRGQGTLRRTILGSVSDYVVHHAQCPVVICRHDNHEDAQDAEGHSKAV